MSVTRREFLRAAAGSAAFVPALRAAQSGSNSTFAHGVASGDPLAEAVVIWTRVSPRRSGAVRVRWRVTTDTTPPIVVRTGSVSTSVERDYTVKIDVQGLDPGRTYLYQFDAEGEESSTGRTRTLPRTASQLRLAIVSCSNYPAGFFNAYAAIAAREDIDLVVHLGDYIYEYANGTFGNGTPIGRIPDPEHETITLDDYRRRYAIYRRDADLQALHQRYPLIAIWDDHELADNAWAGGTEGWAARRAAAMRAYREWMPIRESGQGADFRLYRSFSLGTLASLTMLDTRSLRDGQVFATDAVALRDPRRRVLGSLQERWLNDTLRASKTSGTTWRLIGQQVMFSPFTPPDITIKNPDAWDGYQAERARIRALLGDVGNAAILTGDVHSSWAFDVPLDPWRGYRPETGEGSVAVELITPAVSSQPYFTGNQKDTLGPGIRASLPHLRYLEGENRGYMLLDVTPARLEASWHHTPDVQRRSPATRLDRTLIVEAGSSRLTPG